MKLWPDKEPMDQGFDTSDVEYTALCPTCGGLPNDAAEYRAQNLRLVAEIAALRHELDTLKAGRAHGAPHRWVPPGARPHGGR